MAGQPVRLRKLVLVAPLVLLLLYLLFVGYWLQGSAPQSDASKRPEEPSSKPEVPVNEVEILPKPEPQKPQLISTAEDRANADAYKQCRVSLNSAAWPLLRLETTKGTVKIQLRPDLTPHGVQHLLSLVANGYYNQAEAQVSLFHINYATIMFGAVEVRPPFGVLRVFPDNRNKRKDSNPCPSGQKWDRGVVAMMGGPHVMIIVNPNEHMGKNEMDAPAGYVVEGMEVVEGWHRYSDDRQQEVGGQQEKMLVVNSASMLREQFPLLDYITDAQLDVVSDEEGRFAKS